MAKLTKEQLIDRLNYDLSAELKAIVQYLQHSFLVKGLIRELISERLESIAEDEMKHAKELAERIVALGGVPTTRLGAIAQPATMVEMLKEDLAAEVQALKDYAERRDQCEDMGEVGTALIIENIIVDEQHHHDTFLKLLMEEKAK